MKAKVYSSHTNPPLSTNWWALALRGTVALLFGIAAWIIPGITLTYLVFLFGAFALLDGVFNIAGAIRARRGHDRWWALLLVGLAGITAGILTFFYPGLTALTLLYFIAAWAIWSGVFQIVAAIRLRKQITGEWLLALGGALSLAFGLLLVFAPGAGILALLLWISVFAVVSGVILILLALRLRSLQTAEPAVLPRPV